MEDLIKLVQLIKGTDPMFLVTVVCLFALYVVHGCVKRLTNNKSGK